MPVKQQRSRAFVQAFAEAVRLVALDYAGFVTRMSLSEPVEDPKIFAARHSAARICLAHLVQLLDIIGDDTGVEQVRESFALLHQAKAALGTEDAQHDADSP